MALHSDRAQKAARRLRRNPTAAEKALWMLLRQKALAGLRFRRQTPIGPYVVDFCCLSHRLIVEVDGGVHRLTEERDAVRDAWLAAEGFRMLRVSNEDVMSRMNGVLDRIKSAALTPPIRPAPPATFPRMGGRS
ncbi:endonuclease domain-containing protein [Brevundimonas sp. S30B]|uniref:endonuclease domain-containing protein n=1 Tax=unclassified Brevundimonas TaxID=2622653 RepID=UPI001071C62B|nr:MULTISPECIES: DUF559 domain-containing protein [unclassified Brevundimonas]QBX37820.1 endonuclease domain-containing protein [Brevundimonas sp. MF30-B]TFW02824.1 endonuclease domain-containing protein [Brevundimonas sp. S30B]